LEVKTEKVVNNLNQFDPWTEEELEILQKYYRSLGAKKLSEMLNRPFWGVCKKASRLNLNVAPRENPDDVKKVESLSEIERAYLAGIFDGEGTISIKEYGSGGRAVAYLTIVTTDFKLNKWLIDKIGEYSSSSRTDHETYRQVYNWHSERPAHVLAILLSIAPFSIIKKEHIQIVSRCCVIRLSRPRASSTTKEERDLMHEVRKLQMKRNHNHIPLDLMSCLLES
jgi:hypothetical protein